MARFPTRAMAAAVALLAGAARAAVALGAAATLASCANDVGGDVPPGVVVATYRSPAVDLARRTFAIVTEVGVVSDDPAAVPVASPALLASVTSHLESRGFVKSADVDPASTPGVPIAADLAVNVTALESDRPDPASWLSSPGHAPPGAWGYPGYAWSYGWAWLPIATARGTVVVEIADLSGATAGGASGSTPLPVGWAAVAYGASSVTTVYDGPLVLDAIDRAFSQSPELVAAP